MSDSKQSMGDFILNAFSIPDELIQPRPDSEYSFEYEFKTFRFTHEVGMDEQEKQFLVHLIEKYGAPAVVREIKARLAAMIDLDWKFDRGRWERQLNNLNREAKVRHNLSRVAKELSIANKYLRRFRNSAEINAMSYSIDIGSHRRERDEKAKVEERRKVDAEKRKNDAEAWRKARDARKEKRAAMINKLMDTHREYLEKKAYPWRE